MSTNNNPTPNSQTKRSYQEMKDSETNNPTNTKTTSPQGSVDNQNEPPEEGLEEESTTPDKDSTPDLMQLYQDYQLLKNTGSQSKDPIQDSSQIDPDVLKEMLVNDIVAAKTNYQKLQGQLKDTMLKSTEISQITGNRSMAQSTSLYQKMLSEVNVFNAIKYVDIEIKALTSHNNTGDMKETISKSSQNPISIIDGLMNDNKNKVSTDMTNFAQLTKDTTLPKGFLKDTKYKNCIVTSLTRLLNPNDRKILKDIAEIKLSKKLRAIDKHRSRVYEVYRVFNNHRKNASTKSVITEFFKNIFKNYDSHIDWMMNSSEIDILLIVNREIYLEENVLSLNSIIGGVAFSVHSQIAITINCLGIHFDYRYNSFGPILVHLCQVIGACKIESVSKGVLKNNYQMYLACQRSVEQFYKDLGFSEVIDYTNFQKGGNLADLGKHMEIEAWINVEIPQRIMEISQLCFRMINRVRVPNFIIEDCLYDNSLLNNNDDAAVEMPKTWKQCVLKTLEDNLIKIQDHPIGKTALSFSHENGFIPSSIYRYYKESLTMQNIGYLYQCTYESFVEKKKSFKNKLMRACVPIMKNLSIYIYQDFLNKNRDPDDCWCKVKCLLCGKKCYIKNMNLEPMTVFLMKVIFSTWSKHVFALAPKDESLWDQAYPLWYICSCRHGSYYEDLRSAYIQDVERFDKKKNYSGYYAFYNFLEVFLYHYTKSLRISNEKASVFLTAVYAEYQTYSPSESSEEIGPDPSLLHEKPDIENDKPPSVENPEEDLDEDPDDRPISSLKKKKQPPKKDPPLPDTTNVNDNDDKNPDDTSLSLLSKKEIIPTTKKSPPKTNTNNDNNNEDLDDIPLSLLLKKPPNSIDNPVPKRSKKGLEDNYSSDNSQSSSELLNQFCPSKTDDWVLTEERLAKIENPQIQEKIVLYNALKKEMLEIESAAQTTKSRRQCSKGYVAREKVIKKKLQTIQFELQTFVRHEDWYKQAKKDISIQSDLHSIEYVDVSSRDILPSASVKYLEEFSKMNNDDKQDMFEDNNTHKLNDKNHFVMYYGKKNKAIVVHESWFEVNTEQFQGRRINLKTVQMCKNNPNRIQKLKTSEKKNIKKTMDLCVDYKEIERIERIKSTGNDAIVFTHPDPRINDQTVIKYKGYDKKCRSQYLTDAWLKLNFSHCTIFWRDLKNLKVGQQIPIPIGASNNKQQWMNVAPEDRGPVIYYQQKNNSECLYYSLASVFQYTGQFGLVQLVLNEFNHKIQSNRYPHIGSLVSTLSNRKNQKFCSRKAKFIIKKIKKIDAVEITQDPDKELIYHCIMRNNHAIAMYRSWIFDPIFPNAVRRNIYYLKFCAESTSYEDPREIFQKVYSYNFLTYES